MSKKNSLNDLIEKYPNYLILIKAGCFYDARYESAKILNEIFDYKLCMEVYKNFSRVKTGFPINEKTQVLDRLKLHNINYIVVEDYEITDKYSDGDFIEDSFENEYNEQYKNDHTIYIVTDINTGICEKIKLNSLFGSALKDKKTGDIVNYVLPTGEELELKIIDVQYK